MLVKKRFEATIDVRNPISFCCDPARNLLAALRNQFEGRCFKGAFVVRVLGVVDSSECRVVTSNLDAAGVVDVRFEADAVVLARWDILVGAVVRTVAPVVTCEFGAALGGEPEGADRRAAAVVTIRAGRENETLAVGQRVALRLADVFHPPLRPAVAAVGVLLTCDRKAPAWRLRGSLAVAPARADLRLVFDAIVAELGRREALVAARPASLVFFESLLYAFRGDRGAVPELVDVEVWPGGPVWRGPRGREAPGETRNVLEITRRALEGTPVPVTGVWSRPLAIRRSSPLAAVGADGAAAVAADGVPTLVFAEMLRNILDFLVAVRELVETYDTPELVESHRNLWLVMTNAQSA